MNEIIDEGMGLSLANPPVITKSQGVFRFSKLTREELATKVETFLHKKGYKLEEGTPYSGQYGKGSRAGRILLGAFIKRFAWSITINDEGGLTTLTFYKQASGMVGGIIGVSQVNKEFNSIINSLINFHKGIESKK